MDGSRRLNPASGANAALRIVAESTKLVARAMTLGVRQISQIE
jgi:hypothetical protein